MEHEFSPRPLSPRSHTQLFAASSMSFATSSDMAARGLLDLNHRGAAGYQEGWDPQAFEKLEWYRGKKSGRRHPLGCQ